MTTLAACPLSGSSLLSYCDFGGPAWFAYLPHHLLAETSSFVTASLKFVNRSIRLLDSPTATYELVYIKQSKWTSMDIGTVHPTGCTRCANFI
ncbi:hypothetical protein BD311DRAFT_221797 [Dichomitus squalens]|uniref:Uncharacterized protein n=1 Tax=Dichomitus squalens TaxID=114155 RepID=A0A4Q9M6A6_9APHY|nr:hypothetical protein BD311DRAFT_221797 [Dichomitus squalens]